MLQAEGTAGAKIQRWETCPLHSKPSRRARDMAGGGRPEAARSHGLEGTAQVFLILVSGAATGGL